jgi:hypothetical protein
MEYCHQQLLNIVQNLQGMSSAVTENFTEFTGNSVISCFFLEGGVGQTEAWMPAFMLAY